MAMSVGEVYMGLNLDSRKYKKSLQQMQTHTDGATNRMGSTFKKLGGVIAGAFAVGAVVHFGKTSVKASEEAVVAETKLATVMRQRAGATNAQIKSINDLTVSEQALGVVEDDVSKSGAQQLGTFINTADSLKTLIPTMNNLLAQQKGLNATHEDAINIGNLMGKAMQGQTSSLKRVGITFSEAEANVMKYGNESQRAAMLSQIITNNVGQMNKALAATPYGQITQLKNNFGDLMENIGAGLMNLLMPMLKLLNNIIMKLQVVANGFKNFASAITGVNNDALGGIATDATNASDNILDIGDSAEETATKIEKSLAGFDEINKLSDNSSAVAAQPNTDFGGANLGSILAEQEKQSSAVLDRFIGKMNQVKTVLSTIAQPFRESWENEGEATISSIKNAFLNIWQLIQDIGSSLLVVWSNGTGERVLSTILQIVQNIFNVVGNLALAFDEAWNKNEVGTRIVQHLFDIFQTILDVVREIIGATAEWATKLDFSPVLESIDTLLKSIQPLFVIIGDAFTSLWTNVLLPLASWTIQEAVPVLIDALAAAFETLNAVLMALQPLGEWLWNELLNPLGAWAGDIIIGALSTLVDLLNGFASWCANNKGVVQAMAIVAGSFVTIWKIADFMEFMINIGGVIGIMKNLTTAIQACTFAKMQDKLETIALGLISIQEFAVKIATATGAVLAQTWAFIANTASKVASTIAQTALSIATGIWSGVCAIATGITTAFGAAIAFLTSPIGIVVVAIAALIAIGVLLYKNWDTVKEKLGQLKDRFVDSWNGIVSTAKSMANGVLGAIQSMVNGVIKGLNFMIRSLNKIQFDVPEWVPLLGGKHFGLNINEISQVQLPRLAQGGYVKANQPQLAMIGDNKREGEIVAPESKITEAVAEGLKQVMAMLVPQQQTAVAGGDITIPIYLDGGIIDTVIVSAQNRRNLRSGGRS